MQIGKYRLIRKLVEGEVVETFLAEAADSGRAWEVQRVLPAIRVREELVEASLADAERASRLDHPNVQRVVDFGHVDGTLFRVMEPGGGPTLRQLIQVSTEQGAPLPPGVCAAIVGFAARGLAYVHTSLEWVHGDVKPGTVRVSREGVVKVVDFGIAKLRVHDLRTRLTPVDALAYRPPEQFQGQAPDVSGDVYGLGMVLYELLTGLRPFAATDLVGTLEAIRSASYVPAVARRPDLPEAMQRILERALAKDPAERYPDCQSLQADLERFTLSLGEPVGLDALARWVARVA
ncbi:serine/threonine-protein kinase [Corallococcus aberystwythensis]|uniref:Serine/threonine protein kinase n=1 Tax=Corallococcus aberystwythensis TaxID=2316722 RepID=A0A3A8QLQ3_9BACT|nr:serine/threonine-protein kinase [Corallococcus aberystwythensis]RKH69676.1 serine/threonine protein kinase [Corallococcus aberystwythensis]